VTGTFDSVTVRVADASDLPAIAGLRSEWSGEGMVEPGFARRLADWFEKESEHRTTWLAFDHGRPIGMVSLVEFRRMPKPGQPDAQWGYLSQMFVREEARNRRIGAQLLGAVISTADQRGYVRIVLSPSARAVPFFRRAGFSVADEESAAPLFVRPGCTSHTG
jgi:GNAT superfamily N-acetyltransferase